MTKKGKLHYYLGKNQCQMFKMNLTTDLEKSHIVKPKSKYFMQQMMTKLTKVFYTLKIQLMIPLIIRNKLGHIYIKTMLH